MKALVLENIGDVSVKEVQDPTPQAGEVLVAVKACGICGSDVPRSFKDGAHNMPLIIGHEFSGQIAFAGEGVSEGWIGKRVGIFPLIPCKKCGPCQHKQYEMCQNYSYLGSRRDGGFAEYVSVPEWNIIELPESVTFEQAAMLEPMAVAVHSMRKLNPTPEDKVVVVGLGTIGLFITMFLIEAGVNNIYVVGNKDFQKKNALELGIAEENYCDAKTQDVLTWVKDKTDGLGATALFECVGRQETYSQVIDMAAPSARICLVGNPYGDMSLSQKTYWQILRHQLTVTGTWNSGYTGDMDDDWHYVLSKLADGSIHPERFISHSYELDDIVEGLEIMRDKREDYVKIIARM